MTDLEIQEYIERNCRDEQGGEMMDEQTFYEGAKWYRDNNITKSLTLNQLTEIINKSSSVDDMRKYIEHELC